MPPRSRLPADIVTYSREEFLTEVWDYRAGDAVTILAPYGGGKSWIMFQLLEYTVSPALPCVVFVMKPKDSTVEKFRRKLKLLTVRGWPPSRLTMFIRRPNGWVLWPLETDDPDRDDARFARLFRRALRERYRSARRRPNIVVVDESYSMEHELGLQRDLDRVQTKGRSVGCGLWRASQRPVHISRWSLQAQHLFIAHDPDLDAQRRYGEIGAGINPDIVREEVAKLPKFHFLYINRDERTMCIIGP